MRETINMLPESLTLNPVGLALLKYWLDAAANLTTGRPLIVLAEEK